MTDTIDITVFDEAGKFSSIPELNPELTVREVLEAAKSFLDLADSNASYFLTLEKNKQAFRQFIFFTTSWFAK